ncbi:hypothetical protein ABIA53_002239 [Pseudomonas monsensis]
MLMLILRQIQVSSVNGTPKMFRNFRYTLCRSRLSRALKSVACGT